MDAWRHISEAYTPVIRDTILSKAKEVSIQSEQLSMAAESSINHDEE